MGFLEWGLILRTAISRDRNMVEPSVITPVADFGLTGREQNVVLLTKTSVLHRGLCRLGLAQLETSNSPFGGFEIVIWLHGDSPRANRNNG